MSSLTGDRWTALGGAAEQVVRARFLSTPRELSGSLLASIEDAVESHAGSQPGTVVAEWYRGGGPAEYGSLRESAAYLGAYGPRSILKLQESMIWVLLSGARVPTRIRVSDFGCGPYIGLLAMADLWRTMASTLGRRLVIEYIPIDRAPAMLDLGAELLTHLPSHPLLEIDVHEAGASGTEAADWLFISNVLNEGEGVDEPRAAFREIYAAYPATTVIAVEPATESPCRSLCSLARGIGNLTHLGPCPSDGRECSAWVFRQFSKRAYEVEASCLGDFAPAARLCKFGLGLYGVPEAVRRVPPGKSVVISARRADGSIYTCRAATRRTLTSSDPVGPWDLLDDAGSLVTRWP